MKQTDKHRTIKLYLIDNYIKLSYNGIEYVHAIKEDELIKAVTVEQFHDIIYNCTVCERSATSKGNIYKLRAWNSKESFETLKAYAKEIKTLCTIEEFESEFAEWKQRGNKGNRGNYFEYIYCILTGARQVDKLNATFTESGDVVLNGIHQQLKLWNATYTDTVTINNLNKRL